MIESVNNERVKYWTKLNEKKFQDEENLFLVEGEHQVEEASKLGYLKEVIVLEGREYTYENKTFVKENVMKKISSLTNVPPIIGVAAKLKPKEIAGNVLLLDNVRDPGNLGTIIRSSVAFNIDTIVLSPGCVNLYNPKVIRATEGLLFHINIVEKDLKDTIKELKEKKYTIYATDVTGGKELSKIAFSSLNAIIMGNEGSGVNEDLKKLCDEYLYIEMNPECESLNVGVATSIILYEMNRK